MAYTTIKKPSEHFDTNLYTANGTGKTITGMNFQPDFVWTKNRDNSGYINAVVDAVRGGTKKLFPNTQDGVSADSQAITAFNSDGYTFGSSGSFNNGTDDYVNWCWKGGNGTVTNTDGTTTSTVSLNSTAGFSIVNYVGTGSATTVGHGLGSTPDFIMGKGDLSNNWVGYIPYLGNNSALSFNDASGFSGSHLWNNTDPTDTVFSLGTVGATNNNGTSNTVYCFKSVQGYSKFGTYVGNGSTDGTFVYTGFKPAFMIFKEPVIGSTNNWHMYDSKRDTFNVVQKELRVNQSIAETIVDRVDFLSNGFKLRTTGGAMNSSGTTYWYMAFAEEPLVGDNPATAR